MKKKPLVISLLLVVLLCITIVIFYTEYPKWKEKKIINASLDKLYSSNIVAMDIGVIDGLGEDITKNGYSIAWDCSTNEILHYTASTEDSSYELDVADLNLDNPVDTKSIFNKVLDFYDISFDPNRLPSGKVNGEERSYQCEPSITPELDFTSTDSIEKYSISESGLPAQILIDYKDENNWYTIYTDILVFDSLDDYNQVYSCGGDDCSCGAVPDPNCEMDCCK